MGTASLVVAICGLVLACLSLGWQAATFVLTGGRVRVVLRVGGTDGQTMVTSDAGSLSRDLAESIIRQGMTPVVVVRVANVGRQPVTVSSWSLVMPSRVALQPLEDSIGPSLPHRLEVGESGMWAMPLARLLEVAGAAGGALGEGAGKVAGTYGKVELADGREKRTEDTLR